LITPAFPALLWFSGLTGLGGTATVFAPVNGDGAAGIGGLAGPKGPAQPANMSSSHEQFLVK
jgi:hypothetical protein